jgi:nucleoside-diphosphate-sugar epimerase
MIMKISILGLGWFGSPLASLLIKAGHQIAGSTRSEEKQLQFQKEQIKATLLAYPTMPSPELLDADIVILNIPPFPEELNWFQSFNWNSQTWMIFISSTSVTINPDSDNAQLLKAQEEWVKASFSKWTILRFGGLIGNDRHPAKYLSGKKGLSGRLWPVNLIHKEDCLQVTKTIIDQNIHQKIFNVVSDEHPTREDFYTACCMKMGMAKPEFDQNDASIRASVSNEELKSFYPTFKKLL